MGARPYLRRPVKPARGHYHQSLCANSYPWRCWRNHHRPHCGQVGRLVVITNTKVSDVSDLRTQARQDPQKSFLEILKLADSEDWKEREVAATLLVEASKKKSD